jgi:hypothetical protein
MKGVLSYMLWGVSPEIVDEGGRELAVTVWDSNQLKGSFLTTVDQAFTHSDFPKQQDKPNLLVPRRNGCSRDAGSRSLKRWWTRSDSNAAHLLANDVGNP